jgi:hypothetical protein
VRHEFEKYTGSAANIILPKRCRVIGLTKKRLSLGAVNIHLRPRPGLIRSQQPGLWPADWINVQQAPPTLKGTGEAFRPKWGKKKKLNIIFSLSISSFVNALKVTWLWWGGTSARLDCIISTQRPVDRELFKPDPRNERKETETPLYHPEGLQGRERPIYHLLICI